LSATGKISLTAPSTGTDRGIVIDGFGSAVIQMGSRPTEAVISTNSFGSSPINFKVSATIGDFSTGTTIASISSTGLDVTGNISATSTAQLNGGISIITGNGVRNEIYSLQTGNSEWGIGQLASNNTFFITNRTGSQDLGYAPQSIQISSSGVVTVPSLVVTGAISQTSPAISINNASAGINFGSGATEQIYRTGSALGVYAASTTVGLFSATGLAVTGTISATARITTNESTTRSGLTNATITAINTSTAGSGSPSLYVENNSDTGYGAIYAYAKGTRSGISPAIVTQLDGTTTDYHIAFINDNGIVGSISTNGSATTYNTSSDYRLKEITGPVVNSGSFIDALKPKVGTWKLDGSKFVGFIAHEFAEVSPLSVSGEKDAVNADGTPAYQSMQAGTPEVIANIVAELQSLRKRLAALESK
jgi:hypothetical protein